MTDLVDDIIYKLDHEVTSASDVNTALRYLRAHQTENFSTAATTEPDTGIINNQWYKHAIVKSILITLIFSVVLFAMVYFNLPSMIPFSKNVFFNTLGVTIISSIILATVTFLIIR
jgi:hypothetical protein